MTVLKRSGEGNWYSTLPKLHAAFYCRCAHMPDENQKECAMSSKETLISDIIRARKTRAHMKNVKQYFQFCIIVKSKEEQS